MQSKRIVWLCMFIGGSLGGYLPIVLWGAPGFSFSTLFGNALGAIVGIYVGFKLTR